MFEVENLRVRRNSSLLLSVDHLELPSPGVLFLLGSGGSGKSTTLAALAGVDFGGGLEGSVRLSGRGLDDIDRCFVPQQRRGERQGTDEPSALPGLPSTLCADVVRCGGPDLSHTCLELPADWGRSLRRMLEVMTRLSQPADLYLVDEPTFGLDDEHADVVRQRLRELAGERQLVVATHNRRDCLAIGGWCALLAGGLLQELAAAERFFAEPSTPAGRRYVNTGGCSLPAVHMGQEEPGGVWWAVRGLLGGMSRPDIAAPLQQQAASLHESGVRHLICLEERRHYPIDAFRDLGIACHLVPVPDMAPPSFQQAVDICRRLEPDIRENRGVVMHCRGGLGRTGTMLACVLIWFGDEPTAAIEKVRSARPMAIQSVAQMRFIHDFADRISGWFTSAKAVNQE